MAEHTVTLNGYHEYETNKLNGTDLPCAGDTLAEGIAVKVPGGLTSQMVAQLVREIVLVDERHLEESVSALLQIEKTVVDGAGAAGLAALFFNDSKRPGTAGQGVADGHPNTTLSEIKGHEGCAPTGRVMHARQPP